MVSAVLRKLGLNGSIASALIAGVIAVGAMQPAAAQLYSDGYEFLEAVRESDGDTATQMLDEPGTQVVNTRDITTGESGLHVVVARRDALWLRFLLQRGANPNIRDNRGQTPLQMATQLSFVEGVEILLDKGASVDVSDSQGETPLIAAVHQRNVELVRLLLAEDADPDRNDNSGRSARDYVALMNSNTLLTREIEKADAERGDRPTQRQYGPSF